MAIYEAVASIGEAPRRVRITSPVTLEPIGEFECATDEEVGAAVQRARDAQPAWAALSVEQRARYMDRVLEVVLERQEDIIAQVIKETGKPRNEALAMEVFASVDSLCYYAKNAPKFLRPRKGRVHGVLRFTKKLVIHHKPRGVVGVITPWNGPFILGLNPAVQALMAGNTVVVKGSEVTPYSTKLVEEIFLEAGLPEGTIQVLMGDGQTGAALVEAGCDKISFTGSVATGRKVAEACGRQLIPCTLELGGKDAMVVCADADLDRAAAGAVIGSCMNTGQYCCGTERIYVMDSVYDDFVDKVVSRAKALKQSDHGEFDVGAIFWDRQLDIIEAHITDAKAKGARALVGGRRNPELKGLYYEPTVLVDVDHSMEVMRTETFGPVISIMKVASEDEAIGLANDSPYGLNGNVWTRDKRKGTELASRIETGACSVNDMAMSYGVPAAPFGGRKLSGVGQVNGETGVLGFTHAMPILIERFGGKDLPQGYPYTDKKTGGMQAFMNFLWGKTRLGRWLS